MFNDRRLNIGHAVRKQVGMLFSIETLNVECLSAAVYVIPWFCLSINHR